MSAINQLLTTGKVEVFGTQMLIERGTRLEFYQDKAPKGWRRVGITEVGIICEKE